MPKSGESVHPKQPRSLLNAGRLLGFSLVVDKIVNRRYNIESNGKYCTDGDKRMNMKNLNALFDRYIAKFDTFNENYKWAACQQFQDNWYAYEPDFTKKLVNAMGTHPGGGGLGNLTDASVYPFRGMVEFSKQEPDTVQEMFSALFADGDLKSRIDSFMQSSDLLNQKYGDGGWLYAQSPRSVMAYLACWKPDEYFFYKDKEARKFAEEVEFGDSWGRGTNFKPEVYHRMCNELIEVMRQREDLLRVNATRFEKESRGEKRRLWPDSSLHILAHDVIFCSFAEMYNK